MHKGLEKYWIDQRRLFKRDVKAGYVGGADGNIRADLKAYWDDKVEYRSHEYDPTATFSQYFEFVTAKPVSKKSAPKPKKKAAKKKAKMTKRKSSWWFW